MGGVKERPINWTRNALLLNAGIKAVRDAGKTSGTQPKVMLHIAQPKTSSRGSMTRPAPG
jgi:arabinogalactan endo-1,4-beta-galactosidase